MLEVDCRILFGMSPTDTYMARNVGSCTSQIAIDTQGAYASIIASEQFKQDPAQ